MAGKVQCSGFVNRFRRRCSWLLTPAQNPNTIERFMLDLPPIPLRAPCFPRHLTDINFALHLFVLIFVALLPCGSNCRALSFSCYQSQIGTKPLTGLLKIFRQ